ncbi:DUF3373 family protein [Vibrio sp. CAU 1672]|uniref:DUF3373 family protein n=1 Tax=Vibrio sp. CAU 1672 TaxID=3032594 RepID=UPI0023DB11E6|nr:DUF3373 family protein [Vibrio sp. CAU 1672]MDF2153426.1 DUF3373 family protein [Vibrio sp. CAU 1672]
MNKWLPLSAVVSLSLSPLAWADETLQQQIDDLQQQIRELKIDTAGQNLKFGVDYRVTMDSIEYKMADGSKADNDDLISNRLWLNMGYQYNDNLTFIGQLSYNKIFGENLNMYPGESGMPDFDWVINQNLTDNSVKVRQAYFLYHGSQFAGVNDLGWSFSLGRRPATEGFLVNHREGFDEAQSPLGHSINVEFDGLSLNTKWDELTGIPGAAVKFCAGRGLSNATTRFTPSGTDYAESENQTDDTDFVGFIFTPYNNGQYDLKAMVYHATNLIGYDINEVMAGQYTFRSFGNLNNATVSLEVNGIGELINDFLDSSRVFASYSVSQTDPDDSMAMLGSTDKETGYSYWLGVNFPGFMENDSFGIEFNHGSKYWRSFTYGEDTMIGSKLAARGDAVEVYYNLPIIDEAWVAQIRYTHINYDYTGSNGFFGSASGTPMDMQTALAMSQMFGTPPPVKEANDLRLLLRYKY